MKMMSRGGKSERESSRNFVQNCCWITSVIILFFRGGKRREYITESDDDADGWSQCKLGGNKMALYGS